MSTEEMKRAPETVTTPQKFITLNQVANLVKSLELAEMRTPVGEVDSTGTTVIWTHKPLNGSKLYIHPKTNSELVGVLETLLRALENEQDRNRLEDVQCDATDAAVQLGRQYLGLVNKKDGGFNDATK
jgi:hypothetical protein